MQNLFETVKKAQMVVQVEAVRVQKELAAYVLFYIHFCVIFVLLLPKELFIFCIFFFSFCRAEFDGYCEGN